MSFRDSMTLTCEYDKVFSFLLLVQPVPDRLSIRISTVCKVVYWYTPVLLQFSLIDFSTVQLTLLDRQHTMSSYLFTGYIPQVRIQVAVLLQINKQETRNVCCPNPYMKFSF